LIGGGIFSTPYLKLIGGGISLLFPPYLKLNSGVIFSTPYLKLISGGMISQR
jgi:hypothetical protein